MDEPNKKISGSVTIIPQIISDVRASVGNITDFGEKIKEHIKENTTNLLDIILFGAIKLEASDIHIEQRRKSKAAN